MKKRPVSEFLGKLTINDDDPPKKEEKTQKSLSIVPAPILGKIASFNRDVKDFNNLRQTSKKMNQALTYKNNTFSVMSEMDFTVTIPPISNDLTHPRKKIPEIWHDAKKIAMKVQLATEYTTWQLGNEQLYLGKNWDPRDMQIQFTRDRIPYVTMKYTMLKKYEGLVESMTQKLHNITDFNFEMIDDEIFHTTNVLLEVLSENPTIFPKLQSLYITSSSSEYIIPQRTDLNSVFILHNQMDGTQIKLTNDASSKKKHTGRYINDDKMQRRNSRMGISLF